MRSDIDPRLMQQLLQTFRAQLEERLQAIVDGLLALEQAADAPGRAQIFTGVFRDAHNIKGAARGVGLERAAELSHALEDLFSALKNEAVANQPGLVELGLAAVAGLRQSVAAEAEGQPAAGDSANLLQRLRAAAAGKVLPTPVPTAPAPAPARLQSDTVRLPVARLDRIADLAEELQASKIRVDDHYHASRQQHDLARRLKLLWAKLHQPDRSDIRNPISEIAHPTSEIRNPKSEIRNPRRPPPDDGSQRSDPGNGASGGQPAARHARHHGAVAPPGRQPARRRAQSAHGAGGKRAEAAATYRA